MALGSPEAVPAGQLHVTLAYLGMPDEVPFSQADLVRVIRDFTNGLPEGFPGLGGRVNGSGIFTNEKSILVHLIDAPDLPLFRQTLVDHLEGQGMAVTKDHGFIPHMTLAYFDDLDVAKTALAGMEQPPEMGFLFDSIYVMFGEDTRRLPIIRAKRKKGMASWYEKILGAFGRGSTVANTQEQAGEEPVSRGMAQNQIWEACWAMLAEFDNATGSWSWPVDIYVEDNGTQYLIVATDGRLYRVRLSVNGADLSFGSFEAVEQLFVPTGETRTIIHRMPNGRPLIVQIVSTSVLNRVGQIDSRDLFDSFVEHAKTYDVWPEIDFMHHNELVFGRVVSDGLMRIGDCYLAAWRFNDDEVSRAAEAGYLENPEGWGASIEFYPLDVVLERIGGVEIAVFKRGINSYITICNETDAAAWYTAEKLVQRSVDMSTTEYETLVKLFGGDEEAAQRALSAVEKTNRQIAEAGQITRLGVPQLMKLVRDRLGDAEGADEAVEALTEVLSEIEEEGAEEDEGEEGAEEDGAEEDGAAVAEVEIDLGDEENLSAIVQTIIGTEQFQAALRTQGEPADLGEITEAIAQVNKKLDSLVADATKTKGRLAKLEQGDEEKRTDYLQNLPRSTVKVTAPAHRPKIVRNNDDAGAEEELEQSMAETAAETISKWQGNGKTQS